MTPLPPRWIVTAQADPDAMRVLASELRIPDALAALLVQRGLGSADLAKAFLRPDLERLSDPHCWAGMDVALELLESVPGGWLHVRHADGADGYLQSSLVWGQ